MFLRNFFKKGEIGADFEMRHNQDESWVVSSEIFKSRLELYTVKTGGDVKNWDSFLGMFDFERVFKSEVCPVLFRDMTQRCGNPSFCNKDSRLLGC